MRISPAPRRRPHAVALPIALALIGCVCGQSVAQQAAVGGDPNRGATLIRQSGCGACHEIPGIEGADGLVGPPLNRIASRIYIAGVLRNTPASMTAWLRDPQAIVPGNAMPNVGLTEKDARDVAAYLFTLR
ncbi:MAG TPA: c-type cytochrome [Xanthobacteraceae bacterium]|nr:c-type cytochrome [Xanthobacteraceae bacterium]